jgi:hypothetical protein
MSEADKRYRRGLSGDEPSEIFRGNESGYRAQKAGYRDHLRNQDLAQQILEAQQVEAGTYVGGGSRGDDGPRVERQITFFERILRGGIGIAFVIGTIVAGGQFADFESTNVDPPGQIGEFYARLVAYAIMLSGLGYAAYRILRHALSKDSKS